MNLSSLQTEIGQLLNDPSNQRWTQSVLLARINEAQTEIQGFTGAVKTSESLTTAGTMFLNANTMDITRASIIDPLGNTTQINGYTIQELFFLYPNFLQWTPGQPLVFTYDASTQTINVYPTPSPAWQIASGFGVVEVRKPADLVNPTDIPFDSNNQMVPYHMAIVHWVVAQCWMDDGTAEGLGKSKFHKSGDMRHPGQFELQLARITETFDTPEAIPAHILYRPQGGRVGNVFAPNKSNPLTF